VIGAILVVGVGRPQHQQGVVDSNWEEIEMTERFASLGDAELKHLMIELHRAPTTFEEGARVALNDAARRRGLRIESVLEESQQAERYFAAQMSLEREAKERKRGLFYLHYGRVMGGVGLVTAIGVGILSMMAGHVGGMITAFVTAACSLWLTFRKA